MPIFQRAVLRELLTNAFLTFGVITLIFLVGGSLNILHRADYLTLKTFLRGTAYFVFTQLGMTLPMTVLVATVITYGRWAAENEINTLRACGIPLRTLVLPGLLFGMIGSGIVLHVNDEVAPRLQFQARTIMEQGIAEAIGSIKERGGGPIPISDDLQIFIRDVDENGQFHDLRVKRYDEDAEGDLLQNEITAGRGDASVDLQRGILSFELWDVVHRDADGVTSKSAYMKYPIALRDEAREKKLRHYTLAELVSARGRDYEDAPKKKKLVTEYHRRLAGAFACLLFVLVGLPLAVIFRHANRAVAFLIAFLIAIVVYYPTFVLGEVLANETDLNPILAVWSGSGALSLLGVALLLVVARR